MINDLEVFVEDNGVAEVFESKTLRMEVLGRTSFPGRRGLGMEGRILLDPEMESRIRGR